MCEVVPRPKSIQRATLLGKRDKRKNSDIEKGPPGFIQKIRINASNLLSNFVYIHNLPLPFVRNNGIMD